MNKNYVNINGSVFVMNDDNTYRHTNYSSELEMILKQENLVEEINNKIEELREKTKAHKVEKFVPVTAIVGVVGFPIGFYLTERYFSTSQINLPMAIFETSLIIALVALASVGEYSVYKEKVKKHKCMKAEIQYLKKRLIEEQALLEKYHKLQKFSSDVNAQVIDDDNLEKLDVDTALIGEIGSDLKKYYKLLRRGKLDKALQKKFGNDIDLESCHEYLEERKRMFR